MFPPQNKHCAVADQDKAVCAPAGYGKTALLTQFADETELPICWYSLAPEDHDPVSILRYCVYSIRALYPDFGVSCISLLKSGSNVVLHTLAGLFITELHSNVSVMFQAAWFMCSMMFIGSTGRQL